jgi:hypothetical protein
MTAFTVLADRELKLLHDEIDRLREELRLTQNENHLMAAHQGIDNYQRCLNEMTDYKDLIGRLREFSKQTFTLPHDAADAIEALLAERDAAVWQSQSWAKANAQLGAAQAADRAEIDRLREEVAQMKIENDTLRYKLHRAPGRNGIDGVHAPWNQGEQR